MNEEEKNAFDYLKKYINWDTYGERNLAADIEKVLNLVKRLLKENKKLKQRRIKKW